MKHFLRNIGATLALTVGLVLPLQATETYTDPYKMIEAVADKTFNRIKTDQPIIKQDLEHLRTIVVEELLPYVDSRYAAAIVVGRTVDIRENQQAFDEFVKAFEQYMIGSYAGALTYYKEQKVMIEPAKPVGTQSIITIRTRVIDPGKPDIVIDFKLRRPRNAETWLVIDMIAEGISLLDSKRAELNNMIRQQGLPGVTALLIERSKDPVKVPEADAKNASE